MGQNLNCEIVRDLLPNYIEQLTSEETNESVREHLVSCQPCTDIYLDMKKELVKPGVQSPHEVKEFKSFLKYTKMQILTSILYICGFLGIAVSFIVNIALDQRLTWSLIVAGGILLVLLPLYVGSNVEKRKIEKSFLCLAVMLLPYLKLIEIITNRYFVFTPYSWFASLAVPITLLWLAAIVLTYGGKKILKMNHAQTTGMFLLLVYPCNLITKYIISLSFPYESSAAELMVSGISTIGLGVVMIVIGTVKKRRR